MSVRQDIQLLKPMQVVELFEWDARKQGDTAVFRWHPGTTVEGEAIFWNGQAYLPYPIQGTGFEVSVNDKLPRPHLQASNINGELGAYLRSLNGALGAKVTRRRTLGKYLDAVNFPDGNPNADPTTAFPEEIFYVARKINENPIFIELELAAKWDVTGVLLPRRQVIASVCQWVYRSSECSYSGGPVLDDEGHDVCHKTLEECKRRFGEHGVLRTSAFPASLLARQ
jgi:lambda family phage minor tail protein L